MESQQTKQKTGRPLSADRESGYGSDQDVKETVGSLGRLSLEDDGIRNWNEESVKYLDKHYEDWKEPRITNMVPPAFQGHPVQQATTGELTEKDVFDLLEKFGKKYQEPMFVVHSHNFCELIDKLDKGYGTEKEWVQGEHDFVIIHRKYGVIFLEVKSSGKTRNVYTEAKRQIDKARSAVMYYVQKSFGRSKALASTTFKYPGFVIMPNCKKPEKGFHDDVIYKEECFSRQSFKRWWDEKIANSKEIDPKVYEELVIKFVPFSCLLPTVNLQIDKTHNNIVKVFTPRQLKSWYNSSPVQWITGPAGSGKTVLLIEKVKEILRYIKEGERILVLCFNRPLSIYLENEISMFSSNTSPVKIKTYDSFIKEVGEFDASEDIDQRIFEERRTIVETKYKAQPVPDEQMYEHIFVDEGQDLSGKEWPNILDKMHKKPDPTRRYFFWVMFDSNQHVQLTGTENLPWEYLRNASELKDVLRNTDNIFRLSKKYYEGIGEREITLGHKEVGLNITWECSLEANRSNTAKIVGRCLRDLKCKKVQTKDIAVLARTETARNSLMKDLKKISIHCVNAEERLRNHEEKNTSILVESIRRFKGLESKVVILCDPKCYPNDRGIDKTRQLLYTAISRCFCLLIIVSTHEGCQRIKNATTHNSAAYNSRSQEKRKSETSSKKFATLEKKHKEEYQHANYNRYGKRARENDYNSGPPERKEFVDKTDRDSLDDETIKSAVKFDPMEVKQIQRQYEQKQKMKSNQSRPLNVHGMDILEPGDKYITDAIRRKVFGLLEQVVKENISFSGNTFSDEQVTRCVARIEYNTYKIHRQKRNPNPHTKALRKLKREIAIDNKNRKWNQEVEKTMAEM